MQTVHKGRERLQVVIEPDAEELAEADEAFGGGGAGFFDQDSL